MTAPIQKSTVAIDIDEVLANILEYIRLWANDLTGSSLSPEDYHTDDEFWSYYNTIWERHGLADQVNFDMVLQKMTDDQSDIAVIEGARSAIERLKARYDIVFITSRPAYQEGATRKWLDEHIDPAIPLYISFHPGINDTARSKGEICAELGATYLIDDNIGNCQSAIEYGVEAVLFGSYGWNEKAPAHMQRCVTWQDVEEYLFHDDRSK